MSLFTKLLNLHSGSQPLEDFFTEVIAYFLDLNQHILINWLKENSIINDDDYNIQLSTQKYYEPLKHHQHGSQIDIVLELENDFKTDVIFIESKIGSTEGCEQLKRYAEILSNLSYPKQRTLIYITRDYDPKQEIKDCVEKLIPKVNFIELRWYHFYGFLIKNTTDMLSKEILRFMEVHGMSHTNQLSSTDILTMINFKKTFNFMEATLNEVVKTKMKTIFAGYVKGEVDSLYQWKSQDRYIIGTHLSPKRWDVWCGVGYFGLNPDSLTEYPYVGLLLEVSPTFINRKEIIGFMQKILNVKQYLWVADNVSDLPVWSGIYYRKSLREFLSQEDHLSSLKTFLLDSIEALEVVQREFDFPWETLKS
ncbi:hypothetical protein CLI64_04715 [Nostoc sp. CENA543]|uniref:PD-(D/E)XK nuclease family protein n=1 Tax=Nostoc sp. CENA543 TaxID=1869241 RepID=UPI000CA274A5|nr:PD-(D/E)XK nuclease family protein [Nostoc sp. CENA543]AUS99748.1 hypothetical protein CLI64_04715 [Nostoc sp. CENA543]